MLNSDETPLIYASLLSLGTDGQLIKRLVSFWRRGQPKFYDYLVRRIQNTFDSAFTLGHEFDLISLRLISRPGQALPEWLAEALHKDQ